MADIAELGLKIDSSQAGQAARALDQMTASGRKAEDQFAKIERAARMGGASTQGYSQALGQAYGITGKMSEAQVSAIRQYETLIAKTELLNQGRGREAAQLVALRKAGVTADTEYGRTVAALAGNLYDLEQQGGKTNNTFTRFADTLTRRFVVGYLVTQLRQMVTTIIALNTELAKTGDVARFTGIGTQDLQGIQFAGALKGVDSGKLLEDMTSFAKQVNLAKQGLGDLHTLFRLNRETVGSTQEAFLKVADLVKNARSDIEKFSILQAVGLPATREYVRLMEQGSAALKEQAANAPKIDPEQIKLAQELEDQYNRILKLGKDFFKSDFVNSAKALEDALKQDLAILSSVYEIARKIGLAMSTWRLPSSGSQNFASRFDDATGQLSKSNNEAMRNGLVRRWLGGLGSYDDIPDSWKGSGKPTITTDQLQAALKRNSLQQQYLGLLGQTATVEQQVLAVRLQIQANQMNPDAIKLTDTQIANLERLARERALGIDQMKAQTDAYRIEAETIGMSVGQATEYVAIQTKLNEALRLGTGDFDLNTEAGRRNYQMLVENAAKLGESAQKAANVKDAYDISKGVFQDYRQGLFNGAKGWDALGDAAMNALNKISAKLMDKAFDLLWSSGGSGGGIGGVIGAIASLFADGGIMTSAGPVPLRRYAGGGIANSPQLAMFGEGSMPEAYVPLPDGRSIPVNIKIPQGLMAPLAPAPPQQSRPLVVNVFPVAGSTMDVTQLPDGSLEVVGRMIDNKIDSYDKHKLPVRHKQLNDDPRRPY